MQSKRDSARRERTQLKRSKGNNARCLKRVSIDPPQRLVRWKEGQVEVILSTALLYYSNRRGKNVTIDCQRSGGCAAGLAPVGVCPRGKREQLREWLALEA